MRVMGVESLFLLILLSTARVSGAHPTQNGVGSSSEPNSGRRLIHLNGGSKQAVWVVQLSDLHFSVHHPVRAVDFRELVAPTLSMIKPSLVLITGDLTDGKSRDMLTMKQEEREWIEYRNIMEDVVKRSGLDKSKFYDLRGNHDKFGVPFAGGSSDFFSNYSINSQLGRRGNVNSVTLETGERRHVFVGIDTTMAVGLRGPTNLFGHPTDELLADLVSELSQWNSEKTKPVTKIAFGHFPISFSASSKSGNTLKEAFLRHSVSAYLCGHLHSSFGQNLKRLHRSGNQFVQLNMQGSPYPMRQSCSNRSSSVEEFWEWEMGDWRKSRKIRILAIDSGHVSFLDLDLKSGAKKIIVLPTFPLDSRVMSTNALLHKYECQYIEPSSYMAIRALVFSVSPIVSVVARVYDSRPGKLIKVLEEPMRNHEDTNEGMLYFAPWNFRAFEDPSPQRYLLQIEATDIRGRSTLTKMRPFSINGITGRFSWTWKETMVMGCQWDAIYFPLLWISIGFSLSILLMVISLPYLFKKQCRLFTDKGCFRAGRFIGELNRFQTVWFGFLGYFFYLLLLPWFSGEVFTNGGQRLYMTYKGWVMKSQETSGKLEFIGSPDVMVIVIPHIVFVVLPSIIVAIALVVEREIYRMHFLSASGKKEDDSAKKNKKWFRSRFHVGIRWLRKLLIVIGLAVLFKHVKNSRALSRAYEMNLLLHFPVYGLVTPLLLVYMLYRTSNI